MKRKITTKLQEWKEQYDIVLKLLADAEWHKTAEIASKLGLKGTRAREIIIMQIPEGCDTIMQLVVPNHKKENLQHDDGAEIFISGSIRCRLWNRSDDITYFTTGVKVVN